ncbi:MAG: hypothetical protein CR988_02100 [Treponema sp.]|nr:MAG: hypothetical protein CR988_02100 [Treponema sp.]
MKKILAILMALAMLTGFVFAENVVEPSVSAEATLTWGVDLGAGKDVAAKHGFENKFYVYFGLPLYSGDLSKKGEGDVSVQFTLNGSGGLAVEDEQKNTGTTKASVGSYGKIKNWAAQLNFYGAYMTVYAEPSFSTSFASSYSPVTGTSSYNNNSVKGSLTGYGTKLGYANDNIADSGLGLDVGLKFASNGAWNDASKNYNKYALGFDLDLNYDKYVYFNTGVNFSLNPAKEYNNTSTSITTDQDKNYLAFGFKVGTKAVEGLDVSIATDMVTHAVDPNDATKEMIAMDMNFNAKYKYVWADVYYADRTSKQAKNKDGKYVGLLGVGIGFGSAASGDTNFVEGLAFGTQINLNNLLNYITDSGKKIKETIPMGLKLWASYKADVAEGVWIKPYFTLWGETNNRNYKDDTKFADQNYYFGIAYQLGVTISPMEKVEIDLNWMHGDIKKKVWAGTQQNAITPAQHKADNGLFKMSLKLIY